MTLELYGARLKAAQLAGEAPLSPSDFFDRYQQFAPRAEMRESLVKDMDKLKAEQAGSSELLTIARATKSREATRRISSERQDTTTETPWP